MRRVLVSLAWGSGLFGAIWSAAASPHVHVHGFTEAVGLVAPQQRGADDGPAELLPAREREGPTCVVCAVGPASQAAPGHVSDLPEPGAAAAGTPTVAAAPAPWLAPSQTARSPPSS